MGIDNNLVEMQTFSIEFYLPKRRSINGFSNSLSLSTFSQRIYMSTQDLMHVYQFLPTRACTCFTCPRDIIQSQARIYSCV